MAKTGKFNATGLDGNEMVDGDGPPKSDSPNGCLWFIGGVLALILAGCGTMFMSAGEDEPAGPDSATAEVICEQMVEDILKAPSTASFSNQNASGSGTSWTSTGMVDAENSFGAMMRNGYTCAMTYRESDDSWTGTASLD